MKIFTINKPYTSEEEKLLQEIAPELNAGFSENGIQLTLKSCESGFTISKDGDSAVIYYSSRSSLARAFGLLNQHYQEAEFKLHQEIRFSTLFAMIDNARDAVMTVDTIKRTCRILSVMGYTSLMLYLEDMFEIGGEPYFGHLRGRFSAAELRECDDYAYALGIEIIPCIQTLAHLNGIFRWERFRRINDCTDILLADSEETYSFLDSAIGTLSSVFRSRNINIGMDEAHLVGAGRYMQQNGFCDRTEIILRHLGRVTDICRKYRLHPAMWSDMFFRMQSENRLYYDLTAEITPEIAAMVPEDIELVYWDYYHNDTAIYDAMLEKHANFNNPIQFAGGMWKWMGPAPIIRTSLEFSAAALESVINHRIKTVGVTSWSDNGSTCPLFSSLAVWQYYAEAAWNGTPDESSLNNRLLACTGLSLYDILMLDLPNTPPDNGRNPTANPGLYLLFQDALLGLYDRHIIAGRCGEYYAEAAEKLDKAEKTVSGQWKYMFTVSAALCRVLSEKAELGLNIKSAYDSKNFKLLEEIADNNIPKLLSYIEELHGKLRKQWLKEYKSAGLEVQDIRYGALKERIRRTGDTLKSYLNGEFPRIEELEQPRLYRDCREENSREPLGLEVYSWSETATPNIL